MQIFEPKLNIPQDDVKLCAILLHVTPWCWESTYWINFSEVVANDWKKLIDKLKQIKAGDGMTKEKDSQANMV